jgi:peroxiredoxin 2/4
LIKEKTTNNRTEREKGEVYVRVHLTMDILRKFDMLQPSASTTQAVRAVFIIDSKSIVRAILYYPLSNGRNMQEINIL